MRKFGLNFARRFARRFALAIASITIAGFLAACSPAQESQQEGFLQKLIGTAQPKMVKVFGAGAGRVEGFSTGFVVSDDGKILTAQGVLLDGKQIRVVMADGTSHVATILKRDRVRQVALLKIQATTPDFFELSNEPVGQKGDWIVALSNAFKVADKQEPLSATLGVVSLRTALEARLNKRDVAYQGELVLIDAIVSNPGAAGGAVLNIDGKLVGMIGKVINSSETNTRLNYAVPNNFLADFVANRQTDQVDKDATAAPVAGNADLGIVLFKLGGRSNPAYIDRVKRGSPAADAKLQTDDMIVAIAGEKIGSVKDYLNKVETLRPDEEILIIVKRGRIIVRSRITPRLKEAK